MNESVVLTARASLHKDGQGVRRKHHLAQVYDKLCRDEWKAKAAKGELKYIVECSI